ncbi:MAG TPA: methyltransferase domain-containing protein [Thermoanaerobaculia bacterium]|jgi:phosphoethanolamine N-methyltransferase
MADELEYPDDGVARVELVWGEGYISPGGVGEIRETLAGIDVAGRDVLDFGCGVGGVDVALAAELGAGRVFGVDIQESLVDKARERVRRAGLDRQVQFELVAPGPLPFADASFDIVFSKDAIYHVADRPRLFAELARVLRPGGWLAAADYLRADREPLPRLADYLSAWDPPVVLGSLETTAGLLAAAGFVDIAVRDRCEWFRDRIREDLQRMRGSLRAAIVATVGKAGYDDWLSVRERMLAALEAGEFRPGHYRARKPGSGSAH